MDAKSRSKKRPQKIMNNKKKKVLRAVVGFSLDNTRTSEPNLQLKI
jgi:hypothetical protein